MNKFMCSLSIHYLYPILSNDVVDPEVSKDVAIFSLSSKDNQVVIMADHRMTIPRSGRISHFWRNVLPFIFSFIVHDNIIEENFSRSNCLSSSKHPKFFIPALTWSMILAGFKPSWTSGWAFNSKFLNLINPRNYFSSELSILRWNLKVNVRVLINIAKIIHKIMIEDNSIFNCHHTWLDVCVGSLFSRNVYFRAHSHQLVELFPCHV